jgi:predicted amidohydrolase
MKQEVDLIIIPSYWTLDQPESKMRKHDPSGIHESNLIDGLVSSRALEAEACVVFVKLSRCGGKKEDGFLGRSSISVPLKGHLVKFEEPDEKLQVVDVDLSVLKVQFQRHAPYYLT